MNSIIVDLPNVDAVTGKKKKAKLKYFQISENLEMKISREVSFYESDGVTPAQENPNSRLQQFAPVEVPGSTEGNYVDPATGFNLIPVKDDSGNITNGAVPELIFWQNIPLSAALPQLPQLPQSVKDAMDQAGIKASDIIYGLIKQTLISDNIQGIY